MLKFSCMPSSKKILLFSCIADQALSIFSSDCFVWTSKHTYEIKSTTPRTAFITCLSTVPVMTPKKTFSIFLYLCSVHCEINEIPFLKWWRAGCHIILLKWRSISSLPPSTASVHQVTKWSLRTPLWSWWWILGVKHWNISMWGRLAQNGFTGCRPWLMNAFGFRPSAHFLSISVVFFWSRGSDHTGEPHSLCGTKHHGH